MTAVKKPITLTFDNGPTPGITDAVLDVLAARCVAATFFVIGTKLAKPDARALAERAVDEGHKVGNHTLTHTVPLGTLECDGQLATAIHEIDETQRLLGELAPGRLFRPYGAGGVLDDRLLGPRGLEHLRSNGYVPVTWNNVPRDWVDPAGWVDVCLRAMDSQQWPVVVLHDVSGAALPCLDEFLLLASALDVEWRQDFPADCLP
jgi:peptidoglycan-N-acetylglucosamine deacetylase